MNLPPDHADSCAALANWQAECDCGVGIESVTLSVSGLEVIPVAMARLIREIKLARSNSEATRLIKANAVEVIDGDDRHIATFTEWLPRKFTIRVGREWRKVKIT